VENGRAAIEAIEKAESRGRSFGVVVMDMQMPVLDGYQATARLRARGFDRPIIALTAGAMLGEQEKCLHVGCDDFVTKPIEDHRLVALVARYEQRAAEPLPDRGLMRPDRPHPLTDTGERGSSWRILIVDDREDASAALSKLLGMLDHQVQTAYSGQAAIAAAYAHKPDVIISDIGLPDMDGYEVARRLKTSGDFEHTVFIALSGSDADPERLKASGFDHYLVKPTSISELLPLFPLAAISTVPDLPNQ
jgi:CheY-like chemotaxis protein